MNNKCKLMCCSVVAMCLLSFPAVSDVNFGVQAPRGTIKAMAKWGELGRYLTDKLGEKVNIIPLNPSATVAAVADGDVDYMLSNPVLALVLKEKQGSQVLLTMNTKTGSQFAGVIITGADTGISNSAQLKGKVVMAYKFKKSAAAYVFQVQHMKDQGVDPHKDFSSFKQAKSQDAIVLSVKNGLVDGGFIKSGLLEAMVKEGKISWDDIKILDEKSDSLKNRHSTALYPNWTITSSKSADASMSNKIKAALQRLTSTDAASKKAKINGFVEALSLDGLAKTLKSLNLPPYN